MGAACTRAGACARWPRARRRYNPIGYHVGTVWPFDNSIIAWGLRRYGFKEEAARIAAGILDAAEYFDGRLPEAFAGYPREQTKYPVEYPTACSPQAWSTGAPLLLLRTMLGLEPIGDHLIVDPALPRDRPAGAARHPRAVGPDRRLRPRPRRRREAASLARAARRAAAGQGEAPRRLARQVTGSLRAGTSGNERHHCSAHQGEPMNNLPLDLYIAGYSDPTAAKIDFNAWKKAQREGIVMIDGAILIARDADGTMHVKETGDHDVFKGATIGVAGGLVLGLFAPPLLGAMVVGGLDGSMPVAGQRKGLLGYCWPSVLAPLLAFRTPAFVQSLLSGIDAVLIEIPDLPGTWQIYCGKSFVAAVAKMGFQKIIEDDLANA